MASRNKGFVSAFTPALLAKPLSNRPVIVVLPPYISAFGRSTIIFISQFRATNDLFLSCPMGT